MRRGIPTEKSLLFSAPRGWEKGVRGERKGKGRKGKERKRKEEKVGEQVVDFVIGHLIGSIGSRKPFVDVVPRASVFSGMEGRVCSNITCHKSLERCMK